MHKIGLVFALTLFASPAWAQLDEAPVGKQPDPIVSPVTADPLEVTINEWPVPWKDSRPRDPDVAPNGVIWLVGQGGDYAARFDPKSEEFTRKMLPAGSGPHSLIVDRKGTLWITANRQAYIGKMNPYTGALDRIAMPNETATDPHTLVFSGRKHIWFTLQWGNAVGRMNKRSGHIDLVPMQTEKAQPGGISMDSRGRPWIALLGTNALATIDPVSLELKAIHVPRAEARLRRLTVTNNDVVWYTDYAGGFFGRYDPESGEFSEWKTPSEQSGPYAIATDSKGRVWFVETRPEPNLLVGFDPLLEMIFSITPIPSGAGSVRNMVYDPERHALWFGTDTNNLAQALLP